MNNIHIFSNNSFGELRVIEKDGKVWFCLSDVCKALGINNPSQVKIRLDSSGLISNEVTKTTKNRYGKFTSTQIMTFIDEPNLYCCPYYDIKLCGSQVRVHKSTEGYT